MNTILLQIHQMFNLSVPQSWMSHSIDIECHFIHGSDALGCKVVLVSDYQLINDETMNISRNENIMSAQRMSSLTELSSCYSRVFAFDIEVNGTISNLAIEAEKFSPEKQEIHHALVYMQSLIFKVVELVSVIFLS